MFAEIAAEADAATAGIGDGDARTGPGRSAGGHEPRAEVVEGVAALDAALDAAEALGEARAGGETAAAGSASRRSPLPGDDRLGDDRLGDDRLGDDRLGDDRLGDDRLGDDRLGDGRLGDGWLDDERVVALTRALQLPAVREAAIACARVPARPPPSCCGRRSPAAPRIRKRPSPPRCWRSWPCCTATGRWPTSLCNGPRPPGPGTASRRPCAALRRSASGRASCGAA
jgi:hypothetical protein